MASAKHSDHSVKGVGLMAVSVFAMALMDAIVKTVSADLSIWQVFVTRALFAIPLLVLFGHFVRARFRYVNIKWSLIRNSFLALCWLCVYASLPFLQFTIVSVIVYLGPVLVVLLSAFMFGEKVTLRQWIGVFLGFVGVVTVLRPGTDAFSWFMLLPLAGALFYAISMNLTRAKCRNEEPLLLTIMLQVIFLSAGLCISGLLQLAPFASETTEKFRFLLGEWGSMGFKAWGVMALIGLMSALIFSGVASAFQIAPPSLLAAFDYIYIASATLWGYIFFDETPDTFTIIGVLLIFAAGLFVVTARQPPVRAAAAASN